MEIAANPTAADVDVAVAKIVFGVNSITTTWIKQYANSLYSILNASIDIDEFKELYITGGLRLKSDDVTADGFWVGKIDSRW